MYLIYNYYYLSFFYFLKTRCKSNLLKLSWLFIYILPLLILNIYEGQHVLKFVLIVTLTYTLYELGYVYNDTETIKNEKNPTLRLDEKSLDFYEKNKLNIYSIRLLLAVMLTVIYINCFGSNNIVFCWLIVPIFFVYNLVRNRINLVLHFFLVILRYSLPCYLISGSTEVFFWSFLLFPLINLLERGTEKRFNLPFMSSIIFANKTSGRWVYYLVTTVIAAIFSTNVIIVYLSFYYFLYRFFSLKMV